MQPLNTFALCSLVALSGPLLPAATTTINLIAGAGQPAIVFETDSANVTNLATGFMARGDVYLIHPLGRIQLAGSNLFFEFAPGTTRVQRVRGEAFVPSPFDTASVTIARPAMAELGMDFGRNLALVGIPLQAERMYLFFKFNAGLAMEVGVPGDPAEDKAFKLEVPVGASATLVLDPLDPFYYLAGALITPKRNGADPGNTNQKPPGGSEAPEDAVEQAGEGKSSQGLIPFRPQTTYGIAEKAVGFNGHEIIAGSFSIPNIPVQVSGHRIQSKPSLNIGQGQGFLDLQLRPAFQAGINGNLRFSLNFLKLAKLG